MKSVPKAINKWKRDVIGEESGEGSMSEQIVIFGASQGAVKVAQTLKNIGLDFDFFVDNDKWKIGTTKEGKQIRSPEVLSDKESDYKIIIASMYHDEIKEQLLGMGVCPDNIVMKERYLLDYINHYKLRDFAQKSKTRINSGGNSFIIDLCEGMVLGGIEKWGLNLANALSVKGNKVTIITKDEEAEVEFDHNISVIKFDLSYQRYMESVIELADQLIAELPAVIMINRINQLFMASYMIKKLYPEHIRIISVIHSDFSRMYEQNQFVCDNIDQFLCVSEEIKNRLVTDYKIDEAKVYYKDSPVFYDKEFIKQYTGKNASLKIGYGGRLERAQKRSDLLIPLIIELETLGVDYHMKIAGNGYYYDKIYDFIEVKKLQEKIELTGFLTEEEMRALWKESDIFINLSEIEGSCLSMLEAMSYGAVPIVTNTSGAKRFIRHNENGYIEPIGDVKAIANRIAYLDKDRDLLTLFGSCLRELIKDSCRMEDYLQYLDNMIDAVEGRNANACCYCNHAGI